MWHLYTVTFSPHKIYRDFLLACSLHVILIRITLFPAGETRLIVQFKRVSGFLLFKNKSKAWSSDLGGKNPNIHNFLVDDQIMNNHFYQWYSCTGFPRTAIAEFSLWIIVTPCKHLQCSVVLCSRSVCSWNSSRMMMTHSLTQSHYTLHICFIKAGTLMES